MIAKWGYSKIQEHKLKSLADSVMLRNVDLWC